MINKVKELLLLAEKSIILGEYIKAKKLLSQVLTLAPENPEYYYLIGEVYCKQNKFEKSVTNLEVANRLLPNNPRVLHLLGWATFMNGDSSEGKRLLLLALNMLPEDISILCDLAVLEIQQTNIEKAEKYSLQAIELDSSHPQAREVFQAVQGFKKLQNLATKKQ